MIEVIKKIQQQIEKKFKPTGKEIFEFANCGKFSGPILSNEVVVLIDPEGKVLHITHPKLLNDYQDPLISVTATKNSLTLSIAKRARLYPEILRIWQDELRGDEDCD